jgi:hypothetical protein
VKLATQTDDLLKLTERFNAFAGNVTGKLDSITGLYQASVQGLALYKDEIGVKFKALNDSLYAQFNKITTRFEEEHTLLSNNVVRLDTRIDKMQLALATGMKGFLVLPGLEAGSKGSIDRSKFTKGSGQYIVNIEMLRDADGNLPSDEPFKLISSTQQEMPIRENENLIVEFEEKTGAHTFVTKDSNSIGRVEANLMALTTDFRRFATDAAPYYQKQTKDMKIIEDEAAALLAQMNQPRPIPGMVMQMPVAPEPLVMQMPQAPEPLAMRMPVAPEPLVMQTVVNKPVERIVNGKEGVQFPEYGGKTVTINVTGYGSKVINPDFKPVEWGGLSVVGTPDFVAVGNMTNAPVTFGITYA